MWRRCTVIVVIALVVALVPTVGHAGATEADDFAETQSSATSTDVAMQSLTPVGTRNVSRGAYADPGAWFNTIGHVQDIGITSSVDGTTQPAMWLPPRQADAPLLVVLHSWSAEYRQKWSIPYLQFADAQGWAMIAPNFRGPNRQPTATGSVHAVGDVLDAVDHAVASGADPDRVFVVGFSGGGHMALQMAGLHPERFAGVAAWVPVHDLTWWYGYNERHAPWRHYIPHIEGSCGGAPRPGTAAEASCTARSPRTHLDAARAAGLPVYIAGGLSDSIVPPSEAGRAFNQLADPADRFTEAQLRDFEHFSMPPELVGDTRGRSFFGPAEAAGHEVLVSRESAGSTFVLFAGFHEMLYQPALRWFVEGTPSGGHAPAPDRSICRTVTTPAPFVDSPSDGGYRVLDSSGRVHAYGASHHGELDEAAAVSLESTPSGSGYWILDEAGAVHAFGDATDHGDMTEAQLAAPVRSLIADPGGDGYWLLADDGGVFSFGSARFHGSTGALDLAAPIIEMEPTSTGGGYWLLGLDGGVFSFGDADFHGSTGGIRLDSPVVSMGATRDGYWLHAGDGGVFAFGDAGFHGSLQTLGRCELASVAEFGGTSTGHGYWIATTDGEVHAFGDAPWLGDPSLPSGVRVVDLAVS